MIGSTACTTTRYVAMPISRPERPVLPAIKENELQCLTQGVYKRIYKRQKLLRQYAEELETRIDATQVQQ